MMTIKEDAETPLIIKKIRAARHLLQAAGVLPEEEHGNKDNCYFLGHLTGKDYLGLLLTNKFKFLPSGVLDVAGCRCCLCPELEKSFISGRKEDGISKYGVSVKQDLPDLT